MNIKQQHVGYNFKRFKRMASVYDFVEVFVASLRKKVAQRVHKKKAKILDVACGTGSQSIAFANKNHIAIGLDLSPDMLCKSILKNNF